MRLSLSLAAALCRRLTNNCSPEYKQSWKGKETPAGVAYSSHSASPGRRTLGELAGRTTPCGNEPEGPMRPSRAATGRTTDYLGRMAHLSHCPSPTAVDARASGWCSDGKGGKILKLPGTVQLATWPSPRVSDSAVESPAAVAERRKVHEARGKTGGMKRLSTEVQLAGTPKLALPGNPCLNPFFSAWLMGFPPAWTFAALRVFYKNR